MVKTNRSTLHMLYNIEQSATQDSNHDCHAGQTQQLGLARRLPDTEGAKVLPTSDQVGFHLASTHQMAPRRTSDWAGLLLIYQPWKVAVGLVGWPVADGLPT